MHVVLVHWRIKPEAEHIAAFLKDWREVYTITDRTGLIGEFLSESSPAKIFPDTTWHLDPEALGNFKSFVNVALWRDAKDFHEQIAKNYNDQNPMRLYEQYRRRRVVAECSAWRIGDFKLPLTDSAEVR